MDSIIFIAYKKESNSYYGKSINNKSIKYITNINNIKLNILAILKRIGTAILFCKEEQSTCFYSRC